MPLARRDYGKAICTRGGRRRGGRRRRRRRRIPFIGRSKLWRESNCTASAPPESPKVGRGRQRGKEGRRKTGEAFGIGRRWRRRGGRKEGRGGHISQVRSGGSFFIHAAAAGAGGIRRCSRPSLVHPAITGGGGGSGSSGQTCGTAAAAVGPDKTFPLHLFLEECDDNDGGGGDAKAGAALTAPGNEARERGATS